MENLQILDRELFTFLNGAHSPFFDPIMIFLSKIWVWIPLYLAICIWLFAKRKWQFALLSVVILIIAFAISDQLSVFIKNITERLRPCEDPQMVGITRLLERHGGLYSFVSSHASNTFSFAFLTAMIIKRPLFSYLIYFWASAVSYSRIYVGKHYPGDVICGIILGLIIGLFLFMLYRFIASKLKSKYALPY